MISSHNWVSSSDNFLGFIREYMEYLESRINTPPITPEEVDEKLKILAAGSSKSRSKNRCYELTRK